MKQGAKIAAKIETLIEEKGIKRTKLGEILGAPEDVSAQWKYVKFNNFMKNVKNSKINLSNLEKIGNFFGKSTEWFLSDEEEMDEVVPIDSRGAHIVPMLGDLSEFREDWTEKDVKDWLAYPFDMNEMCNVFALSVSTEHMSPRINKGDIIFIDTDAGSDTNNKVAVVKMKHQYYLGRILNRPDGTLELKSDNPYYPSSIVDPLKEKIHIIGVVVRKLSII
jgi:phage repressor protein C with HTH and peptisase S24 domain